ncbi:MAG: hypothetical protein QM632_01680 [Micrococcaceae bacterium]
MEEQELFSVPEKTTRTPQEIKLAEHLPVARIILNVTTIQLDRLFDFAVPEDLSVTAQIGVRVRVSFRGKLTDGIIIERTASSEFNHLKPIKRVYSELPVLTQKTWELCQNVAARYCCTHRDVLRHMIPPRKAQEEKAALEQQSIPQTLEVNQGTLGLAHLAILPELEQHLTHLDQPLKAQLNVARNIGEQSWPAILATNIACYAGKSKGSITVVPDYTDVQNLHRELLRFIPENQIAILASEQESAQRYQNFCEIALAQKKIVIGTRSAIYAPVKHLGLIQVWNEIDENHQELSYPHAHTRDIAIMRSQQENTSLIFSSFSHSCEIQRLVELNFLKDISYERKILRELTPLIRSMADDSVLNFDPDAHKKRLPDLVFKTIKDSLHHGPVLVQVPHAGFFPSLSCQQCRHIAMCTQCHGTIKSVKETLICTFCSHIQSPWRCSECGGMQLRSRRIGSERTAQELGRSFPGVSILSSSGENIIREISQDSALVVATPGAEPIAHDGYAAAILLDADAQLYRPFLNAAEQALARWCYVAALVKVRSENGKVLLVSQNQEVSQAFIRWVPAEYVHRDLMDRYQLLLPPAVRIIVLEGHKAEVQYYLENVKDLDLETSGPYPVDSRLQHDALLATDQYRAVLKCSYKQGPDVTKRLKEIKIKASLDKRPFVLITVDASYLI